MKDNEAAFTLKALFGYLSRYYGKQLIILLDEYDTPMQEAYVSGYWDEMVQFIRMLFNFTFKTNPYMNRVTSVVFSYFDTGRGSLEEMQR